jgi:hypothetical protein
MLITARLTLSWDAWAMVTEETQNDRPLELSQLAQKTGEHGIAVTHQTKVTLSAAVSASISTR